jgi:hypothetical protein
MNGICFYDWGSNYSMILMYFFIDAAWEGMMLPLVLTQWEVYFCGDAYHGTHRCTMSQTAFIVVGDHAKVFIF